MGIMPIVEQIKAEYESGQLDFLKHILEYAVQRQCSSIQAFIAHEEAKGLTKDAAFRLWVSIKGSLDTKAEMACQLDEASKYRWYRGEEGKQLSLEQAVDEWVARHAAGWRDHYILAMEYIFKKEPERYLGKIFQTLVN